MASLVDYERVLLVKKLVYVYNIPPMTSTSRGFRAADWKLDSPDWVGRLRLISNGDKCFLRIEDASSGELFCQAPIDAYPGNQIQPVSDSRRYFIIRVVSDTGRSALLGIGFEDGADSFDLNVALQDHFTTIHKANKVIEEDKSKPKLDLSLKGDIRVNLNINGLRSSSFVEGSQSSEISSQSSSLKMSTKSKDSSNSSSSSKPFVLPPPPQSSKRSR